MRLRYDLEVDALSISIRDTTVTPTELAEGIVGEYDAVGRLVGLEMLDAGSRFADSSTLREVVIEGIGPAMPCIAKPSVS